MEEIGTPKLNESYQSQFVNELTEVIKEWSAIWKQLYVINHSNFEFVEKQINNFLSLREEILRGKLLENQLKEKLKHAALSIDVGNRLLELDMVIRDEQCNIMNPFQTPILQLYENYSVTTTRIKNKSLNTMAINQMHNEYYLYLPVKNKNQISLLHNVDIVLKMSYSDVLAIIRPTDVKNYLQKMLLNETFSKGFCLLNSLNWNNSPAKILKSLKILKQLNGEDMLIFLHDVLDALFEMYKKPFPNQFDHLVFDCLLYIIQLVSDEKYQTFQQVLNTYIEKHFNVEVAYKKLMAVLKKHLKDRDPSNVTYLLNIFKSFKYIMKFIVRSKSLSSELENDHDQQIFENSMNEIFSLILNLMRSNSDSAEKLHSAFLEYVPQSIPDIMTVFSSERLSSFLVELLDCLPSTKLLELKLTTMSDIIHSQLLCNANHRAILLRCVIVKTISLMENPELEPSYQQRAITKLIGDILDLLYIVDADSKFNDIYEIITVGLSKIIYIIKHENSLTNYVVSLMISILHQMTDKHFDAFIKNLVLKTDLLDFLKKILLVFKKIISRPIFPVDWYNMIMLLNSAILKALKHFACAIREYFFDDFDEKVWMVFFDCAFAFLLQPSLQLEQFSCNKRSRVVNLFGDMRIESIILIETMWLYLRSHKIQFIPDMVGFFLEISLIPVNELRQTAIPILFGMMQCEFNSNAEINEYSGDSSTINSDFNVFQNKMFENIDRLMVDGKGDEEFKELFKTIFLMHCENNSSMSDQGIEFVEKFTDLQERLLEYQTEINDENIDSKINCTVNVLNFYKDIQQHKLIISYVNNLYSLHLKCGNFTEAAYTLKVHSELISWSNDPLPPVLMCPERYPTCKTHSQLKESLLNDIILNFNKGKMWECALIEFEELVAFIKNQTYDYKKLSSLLHKMSKFYDNIMNELRSEPTYFRIAYYGRGFPLYLQNKVFIYRGKEFEPICDLQNNTMNQFPNAVLMNNLLKPGPEITDSFSQYIQISSVISIMDDRYKRLESSSVSEKILQHYRVNYVQKFISSKKSNQVNAERKLNNDNMFAQLWIERTEMKTAYSLPNIVRLCPITDCHTYHVSPLEIAIEMMEDTIRSLKLKIINHENDPKLPINDLSMNLQGILDAAVMGGISNYEKAFFTPEYLSNHKEDEPLIDKLKELITSLIPLLDIGLKLHKTRIPLSMFKTQCHWENCFKNMQNHIKKNYNKKIHGTAQTLENYFDILFNEGNEKRYHAFGTRSAEVSDNLSRPSYISSNSMYGTNDFSHLMHRSNKYHTIGINARRSNRVEEKINRSRSQEEIMSD